MLSRLRELTKSFGNQIESERIEQLKKTKAEVEKNVTRILELIKSEKQGKERKASKKEIELVGLVESLYKEYESLYALCDHFIEESRKTNVGKNENESSFDVGSDEEYFSSEEIDNINHAKLEYEVVELHLELASISGENKNLKSKYDLALSKVQELDNANKELKSELDTKGREILAMVKAKESNEKQSLARMRELEGQLRVKSVEAKQLGEKNKGLHFRVSELESVLKGKEDQHYVLMKKLEDNESKCLLRTEELVVQKGNMQAEIDSLHAKISELEEELESVLAEVEELVDQKTELEAQLERKNIEISDYLARIESEDDEMTSDTISDKKKSLQVMDSTLQIDDSEECLDGLESKKVELELNGEKGSLEYEPIQITRVEDRNNKLNAKIRDNPNPQVVERKMEDLIEKFRVGFEDKLRLLYQRILITKQLHYETKESYKVIIDRYKKANRGLEEIIGGYKSEFKKMKEVSELARCAFNGLELAVSKFEEENMSFSNRISRVSNELKFTKRWIKGTNGEIKRLKHNMDCLVAYLEHKEEQEISLRDKIWKLEVKASKESGEKLNLVQEVSQLEKKLAKYERLVKEKDERLLSLGEEKREAIRQLCILVDYHRDRVDHLKLVISKMRMSYGWR